MAFDAVVFDLDGTLLDSLGDIAAAANHTLAAMGLPTHPLASYKRFAGQGLPNLFRAALPAEQLHRLDEAIGVFKPYYAEHQRDTTGPFAGIGAVLDELVGAGVWVAVLSNKPEAATAAMVEHYFPAVPWAAVWGHREGYPPKPDPASCLAVLDEIGATPTRTAFVGDTMADMLTAQATGCYAVGVSWGFRAVEELEAQGAAVILHNTTELAGALLTGPDRPGG
ncbi:MAG: HAD family hydrolase [Planctomycetota bacterium]